MPHFFLKDIIIEHKKFKKRSLLHSLIILMISSFFSSTAIPPRTQHDTVAIQKLYNICSILSISAIFPPYFPSLSHYVPIYMRKMAKKVREMLFLSTFTLLRAELIYL